MRLSYWLLAVALLVPALACRRVAAASTNGPDHNQAIGKEVQTIHLDIESSATIRLVEGDGVVAVTDMVYEGFSADPVSLQVQGATIIVHQNPGPRQASASYTLHLPKGRAVEMRGRMLSLSGDLSAQSIDIDVDMFTSDGGWRAGSVLVHSGMGTLSGRIEASAVKITSDMGRLALAITRCKKVDISGSMLSGRVEVPEAAQVNSSGEFKIIRKA